MYTYGWCRGIEDAELLLEAGFDYIECALTALQLENEQAYRVELPRYLESPLPVRAFNLFLPRDIAVVGPDVDEYRIQRYVAKAAEALGRIGARTAVLGSGRSRNVPEGYDAGRAEEQFVRLLNRIADEFEGTGVVLAVEPLNRKESNLVNSVEEACHFVRLVEREPIRALADFYHMELEEEPYTTLVKHAKWLAHIHVADTGRLSPGTGAYPYDEFAVQLRMSGYDGMISAECTVKDASEYERSLAFMKRAFG
ncbi:Sugar phosphate isomerase/epimerase [Paenibacillus sp. UNC496MF]|uniref:sugar phosphate isomerase/epimerase family protein n=1 Tax=Paenibacillus sp. UNC496MF TaxID=1502753 RepID=UPI0008EDCBBC|nr:sugar phosphate isomerase/epimerase family protein [Paenibacillus sp. UNC496MF]SFJ82649.1 Sugar phosphate isomerase/epimerase [Paenibacillus sp. UNC496MF]